MLGHSLCIKQKLEFTVNLPTVGVTLMSCHEIDVRILDTVEFKQNIARNPTGSLGEICSSRCLVMLATFRTGVRYSATPKAVPFTVLTKLCMAFFENIDVLRLPEINKPESETVVSQNVAKSKRPHVKTSPKLFAQRPPPPPPPLLIYNLFPWYCPQSMANH